MAASAKGSHVLTYSGGTSAAVWDLRDQSLARRLPHGRKLAAVAFIDEDLTCATADNRGQVAIWSAGTGEELKELGERLEHGSKVLALSPDPRRKRLAVLLSGGRAVLWDLAKRQRIREWMDGEQDALGATALVVRPSDGALVIGRADGAVLVVDPQSGQRVPLPSPAGRTTGNAEDEGVVALTLSPRGDEVLVVCAAAAPWLAELDGTAPRSRTVAVPWRAVAGAIVGPPGQEAVVLLSKTGVLSQFPLGTDPVPPAPTEREPAKSARWKESLAWEHRSSGLAFEARCVDWDPTGQSFLAGGGPDGTVRIRRARDGHLLQTLRDPEKGWAPKPLRYRHAAFLPSDTGRVVTCREDGRIELWEVRTGKRLGVLHEYGDRAYALDVRVGGGRAHLATCGKEGGDVSPKDYLALLHDLDSAEHPSTLWRSDKRLSCVRLSPDLRFVALGDEDGLVRVVDATTTWSQDAKALLELRLHEGDVWSVAWSPDGRRMASAGADGSVRLWRVDPSHRRGALQVTLRATQSKIGGEREILDVVFDRNGERLAGAGGDSNVYLWESETGDLLEVLTGQDSAVWSCAFRADGRALLAGSRDGSSVIYDLPVEDRSPEELRRAVEALLPGWQLENGRAMPPLSETEPAGPR